jgi:short-subunit dehydrogenase
MIPRMNISGSKVLLTGATGGIGHAIARALHGAGAQLVLTGRRTDVLEPLAAELGATSIAVDLADRDATHALAHDYAHVDILVANAALPASGHIHSFSTEEIDRALDVNLRAPIVLAHHFAEQMLTRGKGHLVFISSLSGKSGAPGSSIYSATKFGLRGFSQGLREDLHGTGVGVSTVFPGFIRDAGMFAESGVTLPKGVGSSTPEQVAAGVIRAIEHDKGELDVAPASMRLGAKVALVAPQLAANMSRRSAVKVSGALAEGQSDKR